MHLRLFGLLAGIVTQAGATLATVIQKKYKDDNCSEVNESHLILYNVFSTGACEFNTLSNGSKSYYRRESHWTKHYFSDKECKTQTLTEVTTSAVGACSKESTTNYTTHSKISKTWRFMRLKLYAGTKCIGENQIGLYFVPFNNDTCVLSSNVSHSTAWALTDKRVTRTYYNSTTNCTGTTNGLDWDVRLEKCVSCAWAGNPAYKCIVYPLGDTKSSDAWLASSNLGILASLLGVVAAWW